MIRTYMARADSSSKLKWLRHRRPGDRLNAHDAWIFMVFGKPAGIYRTWVSCSVSDCMVRKVRPLRFSHIWLHRSSWMWLRSRWKNLRENGSGRAEN
ncbi:hypothetical protein EUGRSUZ_C04045 [Eucalyptus grandis]|uniref:Uncharacterized protein n=2 Tax=Eucalyptus grandis TaxID=71139 RepID=A0ACC3LKM3_EUCGR|nr:hypothetical protein EUGRSUZ_C04045 [Eucalyptus grandis]